MGQRKEISTWSHNPVPQNQPNDNDPTQHCATSWITSGKIGGYNTKLQLVKWKHMKTTSIYSSDMESQHNVPPRFIKINMYTNAFCATASDSHDGDINQRELALSPSPCSSSSECWRMDGQRRRPSRQYKLNEKDVETYKVTLFFYKQLGCLRLSLEFGEKISNSLATAQPKIGKTVSN